jgi:hypothetical protein
MSLAPNKTKLVCVIGQALDSPERFNFMEANMLAANPQAWLFQAGFMR